MLAIRLQRTGKKKKPNYRLVVSEKKRDLYGKHLEILGNYNPIAEPKILEIKEDRINYWLEKGAQPSPTVHNLLVNKGIIKDKKVQAWKPKKKEKPEEEAKAEPKKEEAPVADKAKDEAKKEDATTKKEEPKTEDKAKEEKEDKKDDK